MPPQDETTVPDTRPPRVQQIVNTGGDAVNGGLQGAILKYAQTSIVTLFLILFAWMQWQIVSQGRVDRLDDRTMFRDAVKDIQHEADRRAGEVKGALDVNTGVMRDLIAELKSARHAGMIRTEGTPKPP